MLPFYHALIGFREPLKSVTCSQGTALNYLVITWIYLEVLGPMTLVVWSVGEVEQLKLQPLLELGKLRARL